VLDQYWIGARQRVHGGRMTERSAVAAGQVVESAAEVYEEFFVPALFGQWPPVVLDRAGLKPGDDVLDVGCGTGVLAREAARQLAGSGTVTGVDVNDGMLAVARRAMEPVSWLGGDAEALPFPDGSFDRVVGQFVLMFTADPGQAVAEMGRVTRPGGVVAVATWCALEESPGYAAMARLLHDVLGPAAAESLRVPFSLGDVASLRSLLADGLADVTVQRHEGTASFETLDSWLHTDIRGWTLAGSVDDEAYAALRDRAAHALAGFVDPDGRVRFAAPALIGTGSPRV
jgi:SAM-dependent methyltransferase